ncbi:hypothetical protein DRQ25_08125 [Candidatus Fermentibacteria bacterium]|nr:MAG: hypothetical protein DRQ25_08125 [Candidatus Fermentibacteria bacterium]
MNDLSLHYSSESVEHYTPDQVLDAVVKTLGEIDLDPCSNPGIPHVPCKTRFTEAHDGLIQTWSGRVFMNPPYKRYVINRWSERLIGAYHSGEIEQAIALLPARTSTRWFRLFNEFPVCLVYGRLRFLKYGVARNKAPFPSAIFYLGHNPELFYQNFINIGAIWATMDLSDAYLKGAALKSGVSYV